MEANFDLIVSGCNTRCKHCYVNGGPAPNMELENALECIERLDELAAALPFKASFTLDNEPINHPDIVRIIRAASSTKHIAHFHHGMTTGIALMRRPDKDAIIDAYLEHGCDEFGITLHGRSEHHDDIVRREGAHRASIEAAEYLKSRGAKISVSLMFNRFFAEDAAEIDRAFTRIEPEFVYFAVPNFTPHANMLDFEPYRGSLSELRAISAYLEKWLGGAVEPIENAERCSVGAVLNELEQGLTLSGLFALEQNELYLSVHQDRRLFIGNTGAETLCIGDLRSIDIAQAAEIIAGAPGNRDYGAFFDAADLPAQDELISALDKLPRNLLYSDTASVICRALTELGVPSRILGVK